MAVDISEYLDAIAGDTEGEEVIEAIRSASLLLGTDTYKTADISTLLEEVRTKPFGKEIRMCIYEILKKLSEAEPVGQSANCLYGTAGVIFGPTGQLATAALYGTATREE